MEKKIYERVEFEILEFSEMDIICASVGGFPSDRDDNFEGNDSIGNV